MQCSNRPMRAALNAVWLPPMAARTSSAYRFHPGAAHAVVLIGKSQQVPDLAQAGAGIGSAASRRVG